MKRWSGVVVDICKMMGDQINECQAGERVCCKHVYKCCMCKDDVDDDGATATWKR